MKQSHAKGTSRRSFARWAVALTSAAALAAAAPAPAGDWSFRLQGIAMEAHGHDQHVLTERRITPPEESATAVRLDTNSGLAWRGEARHQGGLWGWGVDFFWFTTSQDVPDRSAAGAGPAEVVVFEIADRAVVSAAPGDTLFYRVLEDTDLAVWTVDLYALRSLAETPTSALRLQFGLRLGDFDNDYRAVVGLDGAGGTRLDHSSNYGLMLGPMVALAGEAQLGKSTVEAALGQALLLGSAELSGRSRGFLGPFSETAEPAFFDDRLFRADEQAAIPISELRLGWRYQATRLLSFGAGAHVAAWWDVPVPPGVIPGPGGDRVLHENTIVLFGLGLSIGLTF